MGWIEFLPTLLVAVLVVVLPGVPIVAILRLGPVASILLTPAAGLAVLTTATLIAHVLPIPWSIAHVVLAALLVGGVALLLRRWTAAPSQSTRPWWPVAVLIVAGTIVAVRVATIIGEPGAISQTYDNVFHLNAVAYILASGDASPLRISTLSFDVDGRGGFYPALWHAVVALIVQLTGTGIPEATTAMALVVCALVWPMSMMVMVRALLGSSRLVLVTAGALSVGLYAMPYLLIDWGVLYPTLLSFAVVPAALAAVAWLARPRVGEAPSVLAAVVILVGSLAVVALAHPSGLGAVILLALPLALPAVVRGIVRQMRARGRQAAASRIAVTVVALFLATAAMVVLRPSIFASDWRPTANLVDAMRFSMTMGGMIRPIDFAATGLLLAGIATVIAMRRNRSFILLWLIPTGLQIAALTLPLGAVRYAITGTWYTDDNRIASLVVVGGIPLMVEGVRGLVLVGTRVLAAVGARPSRGLALVGTVIAMAVVLSATQGGPPLRQQMQYAGDRYAESNRAEILTSAERQLLERVDDLVPLGALVLGNPWTGASLVSAIGERRTLVGGIGREASQRAILAIDDLSRGSVEDCAEVADLGDEIFVLDFGRDGAQGTFHPDPRLDASSRFLLIDSEGSSELYRLLDCRPMDRG